LGFLKIISINLTQPNTKQNTLNFKF
jgi:hypothetical protein